MTSTDGILGRYKAAIVHHELANAEIATAVRLLGADLQQATDLRVCRDLESQAANLYFAAWTTVGCRFTKQSQARVPSHWHQYTVRTSPLTRSGHSPRNAADPINALLNYGYALAEAEARIAALTVGLDPGVGILHTDQKHRDSLALDLLEPLRPSSNATSCNWSAAATSLPPTSPKPVKAAAGSRVRSPTNSPNTCYPS